MISADVRRRHVFFISGFDPKPASYYHALYRDEAARQAPVAGMKLAVGQRTRTPLGNSQWVVSAQEVGASCDTVYEYVRWDDIVRAQWPRGVWAVARQAVQGLWAVMSSGALGRVLQRSPKPLGALFYALGFLLGGVLLGLLVGMGVAYALQGLGGEVWAMVGGTAALVAWVRAWLWLEGRLHTTWMARILSFSARWAQGRVKGLDARLEQNAQAVAQALRDDSADEVLVVGISVGSMLAVGVVARALQMLDTDGVQPQTTRLSLLTLGQCIPLMGLLPQADRFRADLAVVAGHAALHWYDFSSPADWVSFGLGDPVAASGLQVELRPNGQPVMRSPRFHTLFHPATYRVLVRDKFRLHRQYVMASEKPGDYDYFAITAGVCSLPQRFRHNRQPSGVE